MNTEPLDPTERKRLDSAIASLPDDVRQLHERDRAFHLEAHRQHAMAGIMAQNLSHGVGKHLIK